MLGGDFIVPNNSDNVKDIPKHCKLVRFAHNWNVGIME
jgi:hypothetical protein